MIFNINGYVKFKPKPRAFVIYAERYAKYGVTATLKVDADGWASLQMHELMRIFGPHIEPHCDGCPFETEIELGP